MSIIINKPLVGTQVDWNNPLSVGLVGCWLFNEGHGAILNLVDNRFIAPANVFSYMEITPYGNGANFGATTDDRYFVTTQTNIKNLPTNSQFTISVACMPNFAYSETNAVVCWEGTDDLVIYPSDATGTPLRVYWRDCGGTILTESSGLATVNKYTHIVLTAKDADQRLYRNGSLVDTATNSLAGAGPFDYFYIGKYPGQQFGGFVYHVYLWSRFLTANEIRSLYVYPYQFMRTMPIWMLYQRKNVIGAQMKQIGIGLFPPNQIGVQ